MLALPLDPTRCPGMSLLLSLGALPMIACTAGVEPGTSTTIFNPTAASVGDAGDDSGDGSDGGTTGTPPTSAGDPTGNTTAPASTDPTHASNASDASADGYGTYGAGTYGGATYGGGTYGGGDPGLLCGAWVTHYLECVPQAEPYGQQIYDYCTGDLGNPMNTPQCGAALEEFYSCMSTLDCQQLSDPNATPCGSDQLAGVCGR